MRRVEHLLTKIRASTDNETNITDLAGVNDNELIEFVNDAQAYLQQELEQINDEPFAREMFLDSVANQEAYSLPERVYLGQNLLLVEYTNTIARPETYRPLRAITIHQRRSVTGGFFPNYYVLRNKQILLSPIPAQSVLSGIRINAVQQLPKLDKRRAKITARTVSSGQVTALTVDTTDFLTYFPGATAFSALNILVDDKFSIVTRNGVITARNVPISAISGGGVCTLSAYTPESSTETVTVGDYLVAGANATTHSELPDACEPYLITWGKWQLFERDKMFDDAAKMENRLLRLENAIKGAWNRMSDDVHYIPILNSDYLFS